MNEKRSSATGHQGISYLRESRSFALSVVSILPLVVLYHFGIVQSGYTVRNLAEVWLEGPLNLVGLHAAHVVNVALIIALLVVLWRRERTGTPAFLLVAVMVAEATLYALLLFKGGQTVTELIRDKAAKVVFAMDLGRSGQLFLALGAGVYEELLFRLLMVGGGAWVLRRVFLWDKTLSLAVMLVLSSVLFSAAHYVGSLGEPFDGYTFTFRFVCGMMLGLVFLFRGPGIAVWTHALYNAMVVL
jgi:heme/copper-type cytochrome/quinol oxidase subunit 3